MPTSIYIYWLSFRNTLIRASIRLKFALRGERLRLLNTRRYLISIYTEVDIFICENNERIGRRTFLQY